jgi:hypothetical protein
MAPVRAGEVAHFADMAAPDDPAETRIVESFLAPDSDHPAERILPEDVTSGLAAQLAMLV